MENALIGCDKHTYTSKARKLGVVFAECTEHAYVALTSNWRTPELMQHANTKFWCGSNTVRGITKIPDTRAWTPQIPGICISGHKLNRRTYHID